MSRFLIPWLILPALLMTGAGCRRARTHGVRVEGRILGADGRALPMAHARLVGDHALQPLQTVASGADGAFSLRVSLAPGSYTLAFSGVGHEYTELSLFVLDDLRTQVDVRLGTLPLATDLSRAGLQVREEGGGTHRVPLAPLGDGTYGAPIRAKGSQVRYQVDQALCLVGQVLSRCAIQGTQGVGYEPTTERYYASVLPLDNGQARVIFDPRKLPQGSQEAVLTFGEQDRAMAEVWKVDQERRAIVKRQTAFSSDPAGFSKERYEELLAFRQSHATRWVAALAKEQDARVRQALGSALLAYGPRDLKALMEACPPQDRFWKHLGGHDRHGLGMAVLQAPESSRQAVGGLALDALDGETWRRTILPMLAFSRGNSSQTLLTALEAARPGHPMLAEIRQALSTGQNRVSVGGAFPTFQLPTLDAPSQTLNSTTFRGKWLLVDFWATWCGPCVAELPGLHRAFEAYQGRGLEVLSVSFDARPEGVQAFRQTRGMPMPWKHVWLEGSAQHPLAQSLQVSAIPRVFLVDPQGRIAAMDSDLKGEALQKTLARCLGKS